MDLLQITEKDTKPIPGVLMHGRNPVDITGYAFKLKYKDIVLEGVITDAPNGRYQFPRAVDTFVVGSGEAEVLIIDNGGYEDTSDKFVLEVLQRVDS